MAQIDGLTLVLILHLLIAIPVSVHILLTKNESVALAWIGTVLIWPFVGSAVYGLFGINRVLRRARKLRGRRPRYVPHLDTHPMPFEGLPTAQQSQLFQFARSVHAMPFLGGNKIVPLPHGDVAYPDMLKAIAAAKTNIALSVYIFERDDIGAQFIDALKSAHARGVLVRVLIDEIGSGAFRSRSVDHELSQVGIATARFIPQKLKLLPFINLRNHRKIMLVDGVVGYIGGMNICRTYSHKSDDTVRDIHFRLSGPTLGQMATIFEEDWRFAKHETIELPVMQFPQETWGKPIYARAVPDGPDNSFQRTFWIMQGALAVAQKSVRIMTPYFLPNDILTNALSVCALRKVDVEIIVPAKTDIKLVDWAMRAKFQDLLEHGVKILIGPEPFDHSKVMVVDGVWMMVGSSNWDQRSLRLNFEANLECYDADLCAELEDYYEKAKAVARPVRLDDVRAQSLPIQLRNNFARLFAPYL